MKRIEYNRGNIVETDFGITQIIDHTFGEYQIRGFKGRKFWVKEIVPIRITEKFINDNLLKQGIGIHNKKFSGTLKLKYFDDCMSTVYIGEIQLTNIEYIHEFQNIYFELTGEEISLIVE